MSKRKVLSNKTRFEVFKRDGFTCQYCGGKAPDIVLNADHIKPVAKGGDNDLMNLVTSCFECNSGKSDRELSDDTVVTKQRDQLEQLSERKKQLEMMMEWRDELNNFDELKRDRIIEYINNKMEHSSVNENGEKKIIKWLKKYDFEILLDAIDKAFYQYEHLGNEHVFQKIDRIAYYIKNPIDDDLKTMYYIRGILKNRMGYVNKYKSIEIMKEASESGVPLDSIKSMALEARHWTEFQSMVFDAINEGDSDG